jgi:RNA 2',3'-cyclic 3'-phosphodiesterase
VERGREHARRERLFVAVWPPPAIVVVLAGIERPERHDVRWLPAGNWHVTLRFLGNADVDDVAARLDAATLPPGSASLGPSVERLGRDAVVVPVAGLDALASAVRSATAEVGRADDGRPFHGHITIARLRAGTSSPISGAPVSGQFGVDEVSLVSSTTHPTGPRYTTIGTWRTAGG